MIKAININNGWTILLITVVQIGGDQYNACVYASGLYSSSGICPLTLEKNVIIAIQNVVIPVFILLNVFFIYCYY